MFALVFAQCFLPFLLPLDHWECKKPPFFGKASEDGKRAVIIEGENVVVLRHEQGRISTETRIEHSETLCASFSSTTDRLYLADAVRVVAYSIKKGNYQKESTIQTGTIVPHEIIALPCDVLLVGHGGEICRIDFTNRSINVVCNLSGVVRSITLSRDQSHLAIGLESGVVVVLQLGDKITEVSRITAYKTAVEGVAFCDPAGSKLVTASRDGRISYWKTNEPKKATRQIETHQKILSIYSWQSLLLICTLDGVLEIRCDEWLLSCRIFQKDLHTLVFLNSGSFLALGNDRSIVLLHCLAVGLFSR